MEKMIKCQNCGAYMKLHSDKCPFCGYINEIGAEEHYMKKLFGIRRELDSVDDDARQDYRKEMTTLVKKTVIFFLALVVLVLVAINAYKLIHRLAVRVDNDKASEKAVNDVIWQREYFPKFDELYEAGDYEQLVNFFYSDETRDHQTTNWEHYNFVDLYRKYMNVRDDYIVSLDAGDFDDRDAAGLIYDCFYFYYELYRTQYDVSYHLTDEDYKVLDEKRDYIVDIIHNRMHFTDEEMDEFKSSGAVLEESYLSFFDCEKLGKKYYKQFE